MLAEPAQAGGLRLELIELARTPPRVAVTPGPSLFAVAADVVGAGRGVPRQWIAAARAELEPEDLATLAPIGAPLGGETPGCVSTIGEHDAVRAADIFEWIATLPTETLIEDIVDVRAASPDPRWEAVARHPRRWLVRYARAVSRVWRGTREIWAAAGGLLEREAERVETAVARGALAELMAGIDHRARVSDGTWWLPGAAPLAVRPAERGVVLTPVLGGPGTTRAHYGDGFLLSILYPLPGALSMLGGDAPAPAAALETLLGRQRATILTSLDRPRSAGRLAEAIIATPGAASHHLRTLEAAGLIIRERDGRRVIVHRTTLGSELLGLYERD